MTASILDSLPTGSSFLGRYVSNDLIHYQIANIVRTGTVKELEQILLQGGYNINFRDERGKTFLHYAARGGQIQCAELLIQYGADCSIVDTGGKFAWEDTANESVAGVITKGFQDNATLSVNVADDDGLTLLMYAVKDGQGETLKQLLATHGILINLVNASGESALSYALRCQADLESLIMPLIEAGADIYHLAGEESYPMILLATMSHYSDRLIECMVKKGADINSYAPGGDSNVLLYALENHFDVRSLEFLIENCKANVHICISPIYRTAMMWAVLYPKGEAVVELLLKKGSTLENQDGFGFTPLFYAVNRKSATLSFIQWLVDEKGANVSHKSREGEDIVQMAVRSKCSQEIIHYLAHLLGYTETPVASEEKRFNILKLEGEGLPEDGEEMDCTSGGVSQADPPLSTISLLLQVQLGKAIRKTVGSRTQFDLGADAICGYAVATALVALLKGEELNIDAILEKGVDQYNAFIFHHQSVNLLNPDEKYFSGKHLNWVGEILPSVPALAPLAAEDRETGNFEGKDWFDVFKGCFEELVKKIPEGENKLGASLLVGAFFLGVIVRKEERGEIRVGIFDPHGISSLGLKAWQADFSIEDAAQLLVLYFSDRLFTPDVSFELNPVIFCADREDVGSPIPPLPENEQAALLIRELTKIEGSAAEKAFSVLKNDHPFTFEQLCIQLTPMNWLCDLVRAHYGLEDLNNLLQKLILPFLSSYRISEEDWNRGMKESCDLSQEDGVITFKDLVAVIRQIGQERLNNYSEETADLSYCLDSTPREQRIHLLAKYTYLYLREEQTEKKIQKLVYGIEEVRLDLLLDVKQYTYERDLFFRPERSRQLAKIHEVMNGLNHFERLGYLSQKHVISFGEVKIAFVETLKKYYETVDLYKGLHSEDETHLQYLESEDPFIKKFQPLIDKNK